MTKAFITSLSASCAVLALATSLALAQPAPSTSPAPAASPSTGAGPAPATSPAPAPSTSVATPKSEVPPLTGANSFTQNQVSERISAAGYAGATDLKKDDNGVWRGKATKDGRSVSVAVDFKGNIVETP